MTHELFVDNFLTFTLAIVVLFLGKLCTQRSELLQRYSIPDPVIGGFIAAAVTAAVFYALDVAIDFSTDVRDRLLLYFFAAVGLRADVRTLISGGRPLAILLVLAGSFIVLQNLTGMGMASLFGYDPKLGLMAGSISLTGGVGTTIAWAPVFNDELGLSQAVELGIAANTLGLILACLIGGPIARHLILKHRLARAGTSEALDFGFSHKGFKDPAFDHMSLLFAWLSLHLALIIGYFLDLALAQTGLKLPLFVSCLIGGILLGNLVPRFWPRLNWPGSATGLALLSDLSLGLFLTMALMSMKLWLLADVFTFALVTVGIQALLSVLFTLLVVFRCMGRDYEASVIASGFGGITLGSTATAIANMTSVSEEYGAAHRAFVVVPLVCGFFIDIVNALVIGFFVGL